MDEYLENGEYMGKVGEKVNQESKFSKIMSTGLPILIIIVILIILAYIFLPSLFHQQSFFLAEGMVLKNETCSKIANVTMIYSTSCPHCQTLLPKLRALENNSNLTFEYLEVSKDLKRLDDLGLYPQAVPVVIINCNVYLGDRDYSTLI